MMLKMKPRLPQQSASSIKSSEAAQQLAQIMLLCGNKGEAVAWVVRVFGVIDGFHVLRKLSSLQIEIPADADSIGKYLTEKQRRKLSVYADSLTLTEKLQFPPFAEIAAISEQVRCYVLCKRTLDRKTVAQLMGWREEDVRRTVKAVEKRLKSLKGAV